MPKFQKLGKQREREQYPVKIINLTWRGYKFHEACLDWFTSSSMVSGLWETLTKYLLSGRRNERVNEWVTDVYETHAFLPGKHILPMAARSSQSSGSCRGGSVTGRALSHLEGRRPPARGRGSLGPRMESSRESNRVTEVTAWLRQ